METEQMMRSYLLGGLILMVLPFITQANATELTLPLPVRNLYPPMMRFFDPTPDSALRSFDESWLFEINLHYSTVNMYDRLPDSQLLVDMELFVFETVIRRPVSKNLEFSVRIPVLVPSSGIFDDKIQTFHNSFGMPNGGREFRPNNSYAYAFDNGKGSSWLSENHWELGNIEFSGRYHLVEGAQWAMALLGAVKLPTASEARGWGSGAPDLATGAVVSWHQSDWFGHIEGWIVKPLAKNTPGVRYETYLRSSLTVGNQLLDSVAVIVQAQGGNSPYSTSIAQLDNPPFLISFGLRGVGESGSGWSVTIVENITQETTQDISIAVGYSWLIK
jgi:hypothetical protein